MATDQDVRVADQLSRDTLFKVLGSDGRCCQGGWGQWDLPLGYKPGKWKLLSESFNRNRKGELERCPPKLLAHVNGLHLCKLPYLLTNGGPALFVAEVSGNVETLSCWSGDTLVTDRARLLRRVWGWNEVTVSTLALDIVRDLSTDFWKDTHEDTIIQEFLAEEYAKIAQQNPWTERDRLFGQARVGIKLEDLYENQKATDLTLYAKMIQEHWDDRNKVWSDRQHMRFRLVQAARACQVYRPTQALKEAYRAAIDVYAYKYVGKLGDGGEGHYFAKVQAIFDQLLAYLNGAGEPPSRHVYE